MGAGDFTQAADAFDRARTLGLPWRMFWYQFGAFEAYWRTGRYEDVIALADATLAGGAAIEEVHYWRGMALSSLGRQDEARAAWQTALQLNPDFQPAAQALAG
ncbi:MAG: tetratricopeptide repeat protein [Caldilineaceae bacterium]